MTAFELSRRETLAGLRGNRALPLLSGRAGRRRAAPATLRPTALLDSIAENLLRLVPDSATALGIDKWRPARASALTC